MTMARAPKAWEYFADTGTYLKDLPLLRKQDGLMVDEKEVAAAPPMVAAIPVTNNDAYLDVNDGDD